MYKPGVKARADAFKHVFEGNMNSNQEARSNILREAYRHGQRVFRSVLKSGATPGAGHLSYYLDDFEDDAKREGFLMGWQSDAYANDHGMELSIEGQTRTVFDDADIEVSYEYSRELEVDSVLPGPGVDG
jgi:hypothetical protein